MSNYYNFVYDFPQRCRDLLQRYYKNAEKNDREVTLMLALASASIVMPYEILKPRQQGIHPRNTASANGELQSNLDKKLGEPFAMSQFCTGVLDLTWSYGECRFDAITNDVDEWRRVKQITDKVSTRFVLDVIRNAFAHGGVFTYGNTEIEELVFLSTPVLARARPECTCYIISVSPAHFHEFLHRWLDFFSNSIVERVR